MQQNGANGLIFTSSNGTLDNLTIRGTMTVGDAVNTSGRVRISNGLTLLTEAGGTPGVMNVGTVAGASNAAVGFSGTQTFNNATINLGTVTQNASLSLDAGGTFTLGAGAVVQGRGSLGQAQFVGGTNNLVNAGTISANFNIGTLTLNNSGTLSNTGTLEARNGGILTIGPGGLWSNTGTIKVVDAASTVNLGGTFTNAALGAFDNVAGGNLNLTGTLNNTASTLTFSAATGSMQLRGGTVTGGTVQQNGANGLQFTNSGGILDGVTFRGTMNLGDAVNTSGRVRISNNGLTLLTEAGAAPGVMNVGVATGATAAVVGFTGTQSFNNATINLGTATQGGAISLDSGGTLTLGAGAVVQGRGFFGQANFVGGTNNIANAGTISASISGGTLNINNSGTLSNTGTLEALPGATLSISNSQASITNLSAGTLTGGIWRANAGAGAAGRIDFTAANTSFSNNNADIYLVGANSVIQGRDVGNVVRTLDATLATNSGALRLQQGRSFNATGNSGNFTNTGNLELTDSTFTSTTLASDGTITSFGNSTVTTGVGNRISGNGQINASFAPLTITRGVNMGAASGMNINAGATINLSGATQASQIGTLAQNGSLNLGAQNLVVLKDYSNANFGLGNAFNARTNIVGTGQIIGNNAAQTITGDVTANGANNWTLNVGNFRTTGFATANYQIANSGTGADIRGAVQTTVNGGNVTDSRISGTGATAGNFGPIVAGGNSGNLVVTLGGSTAGAITGQSIVVVSNFSNVATQNINISGNGFNMAGGSATPSPTINLGNVRIGGSLGQTLTVANTAAVGAFSEDLNAGFGASTGAASGSGSIAGRLGGTNNTGTGAMTVAVNTGSAGGKTGTVTLNYQTAGAVNGVSNGLGVASVGNQIITVNGNVYQAATGAIQSAPLNFGTVQVGQSVSQSLVIRNTATGAAGFVEDLNASFGSTSGTGAGLISGAGTLSGILAGANSNAGNGSMLVSVNTTAAGTVAGNIAVNYQTAGAVAGASNGLGTASAGSEAYGVNGTIQAIANVINQASPQINNSPINLGNVRVNAASPTGLVSVTNVASVAPQAALNASIVGNAPITASGSFNLLNPGLTSSSSLQVGMNTATAGSKNGTATINFVSDANNVGGCAPNCQLTLASQNVTVNGAVFNMAGGSATPSPVTVANQRIGGSGTTTLTVANIAAVGAFSEDLIANFGTSTGAASGSGSIAGRLAGTNNTGTGSMTVAINTASAGAKTGDVTLNYQTAGAVAGVSNGLGTASVGNQVITVNGNVYNAAVGTVSPGPIVNVGNARVNTALVGTFLTVSNGATAGAFSEDLNASFGATTGGLITNGTVTGLLAGFSSVPSDMRVGINTATAGAKTGTVTVNYETAGKVGNVSNGLGTASVGSDVVTINANVFQAATGSIQSAPLNFGTVQVGQSVSQSLVIRNTATGAAGFVEDLNASFGSASGTGASLISGSGSLSGILAGTNSNAGNGSMLVSVNTTAAGTVTGNIAVNYATAGAVGGVSNGLGTASAGSEAYGVNGVIKAIANVINQASPLINNPSINLGAVRVGAASPTANVSVTNVSTVAPQAALNASIASNGAPITAAGSFNLLNPGATNNANLQVGLNTSTAGNFTGANAGSATLSFVSDANNVGNCAPNCQLSVASQIVNVSGKVYTAAVGLLNTAAVNFGIVRVGDVVASQNIGVQNTAAVTALNDSLRANLGGVSGAFTGSNTVGGVAAGGSGNITVGLNTGAAGIFNQNGTVSFLSQNTDMADVSAGANAPVTVTAQVNNHANGIFSLVSGLGALTLVGTDWVLDLGNVALNSNISDTLKLKNDTTGPADDLSGVFDLALVDDFIASGFGRVSGLGAGQSSGNLNLNFAALSLGLFQDIIDFDGFGTNASDPSGVAQTRRLIIRANVFNATNDVPEPGTLALLLVAAAAAVMARRRRNMVK